MPTIVDRRKVRELVHEGARLLEVLPRSEYEREHLVGAESLPLDGSKRWPRAAPRARW